MADIIQLLPDNIANQIAAGEVIQRPASAVKELLENAVDAKATKIQLIIVDAGKSLVQVIDNGVGMSETDARMCFERHATSKIRQIDDLFNIKTMGFRGEALASIAAVAQVELKTKKATDALGTYIEIENSAVIKQEPCAFGEGTSISMKNLFFSVPARRNFLKSNAAEIRHIVDEFIRVAMAFPNLFFSLTSNGQQQFYLEAGSLKQRVIQILGNSYTTKLVSVKEETDYMNIYGFVGKPETAKKTRGDQYFFVNNRFIKSAYLNHAVNTAFENLLPKDSFPSYVLFIDLDPAQVDINVHPTKQEIKFEDEKIVYAFVQAAVKHALAQFSVAPSLDFSLNAEIQRLEAVTKPSTQQTQQLVSTSPLYQSFAQKNQAHVINPKDAQELKHWKNFFEPGTNQTNQLVETDKSSFPNSHLSAEFENLAPDNHFVPLGFEKQTYTPQVLQLHQTYIVAGTQSGFLLVHQQLAHERILYEKYSAIQNGVPIATQKSLFPIPIELGAADAGLLDELLPELKSIGYDIIKKGNRQFEIEGTPADLPIGNEQLSIELLLEQFKHFSTEIKLSAKEKIMRCMSRQQAIKAGKTLSQTEMVQLLEQLFACKQPSSTPSGNPTYQEFTDADLLKIFGR